MQHIDSTDVSITYTDTLICFSGFYNELIKTLISKIVIRENNLDNRLKIQYSEVCRGIQ